MRIAFLRNDKAREGLLADAVLTGARKHGHVTQEIELTPDIQPGNYDVACFVGVKSRERFRAHAAAGIKFIYFDKEYSRHRNPGVTAGWEYWRISIDAHHPTDRLLRLDMPGDRFSALGLDVQPWRREGSTILLAGSSAKYHEFYGLKDPTTFARGLVRELRGHSDRPIVYRPKPSWREAKPIKKARYSTSSESISDCLADCWAIVTHGSNACFEALLAGVPAIILGDGVTRDISSRSVGEIGHPLEARKKDRARVLANLAYFQWTLAELASGTAWDFIGEEIHRA